MKVVIDLSEEEFPIRDLVELVERHAKEVIIDGDRNELIIVEPDDYLLEELENRGISWRVV
jgi:hypothetical protein